MIEIDFNNYVKQPNGSYDLGHPVGGATSGGTPALAWGAPSGLVDGNTLTITTDGTNPFGAVGPNVVHLIDPYKLSDGDLTIGDISTGSGLVNFVTSDKTTVEESTAVKFQVESNAKIGKGIKIGTSTPISTSQNGTSSGRIRVRHTASTKTYDFRMTYWPTANRANAVPYLDGSNTWQFKPIWNMGDLQDSTDGQDFFIDGTGYRFIAGSARFSTNVRKASNNTGTINFTEDNAPVDTGDTYYRPYDEVYFIEAAWDQGSADGVTSDGSVRIVQSTDSRFLNDLEATSINLANVNATQKVTDSHSYGGYVRGFPIPDNMHFLDADVYKATGAGAWCRVFITDNADYFLAHKRAIQFVDATEWATGQIDITSLRTGIFQGDLTGCYLNIIGADNNQIGSVALG